MPPSAFDIIAEQRIADAIRRGELDNLPGAGRPLDFGDEPLLSAEQRMVARVFRNAGAVPPEVALRRELAALRAAFDAAHGEERDRLRRELELLAVRLSAMRRR